ncbi:PIN domain-containing protein [Gracilimonas sp.]|uniref:PIN domain-containing protein n=1 Tax=Gracilimonas sp. TaxID=1974203 RepID=UPI0032EEC2AD
MEQKNISDEELREQAQLRLEEKFPGISKEWKELTQNIGMDVKNKVKKEIQGNFISIQGIGRLNASVIIDNNFVIAQMRGILSSDKKLEDSFIYRLLNSIFITAYAPPKLKEELYDKVDKYFSDQYEEACVLAEYVLERVVIKEAYFVDNWISAQRKIGDIDEDDVPYLALALDIKGQAILSLDKIFQHQNDVVVWEMKDAGKVMASFSQGVASLGLIGTGAITLKSIYQVIAFIFEILIEILKDMLKAIMALFSLIVNSAANVPKEMWALLLITLLGSLFFSEDLRAKGKEFYDKAIEKFSQFIRDFRDFLIRLKEDLLELWNVFSPVASVTGQILLFLFAEVNLMLNEVKSLELDEL